MQDNETFWRILREEILPLRPSQYDITSTCNLACEGCLFFSGQDHLDHADLSDLHTIDAFFAAEAARGVRYGYFGGAEPALAEGKLIAASRHIPYGVVFTNGTRAISREIPYRIHVSVWGSPARSRNLRGADLLQKQLANYSGDKRAVFVFTITRQNIDDMAPFAGFCAEHGLKLSFNHFSPTLKYMDFTQGKIGPDKYHHLTKDDEHEVLLRAVDLERSGHIIDTLLDKYTESIIYNKTFNHLIHAPAGLYPDIDPATGIARDCGVLINNSLRHFNTDLFRSTAKCCSPNIECSSCRLYAQSFATLLARSTHEMRHADGKERLIDLWRLWCALFINDERVSLWHAGKY